MTFLAMILEVRDRVLGMIDEGMTLDEVMAARPTAPYDAQWGRGRDVDGRRFVPIVYYELGGAAGPTDR